jgi:hypothetical protein
MHHSTKYTVLRCGKTQHCISFLFVFFALGVSSDIIYKCAHLTEGLRNQRDLMCGAYYEAVEFKHQYMYYR